MVGRSGFGGSCSDDVFAASFFDALGGLSGLDWTETETGFVFPMGSKKEKKANQ